MAIADEFQLPQSALGDLPPELSQDFFATLDESFRRQEKRQFEGLLEQQESRGLLESGDTQRRLVEELLGPSMQRRKESLLPIAMEGARTTGARRFQREGESQQFERQRQFAAEEHTRQLELMERQRQIQESIFRLQDWLGAQHKQGSDFGSFFGGALGAGVGSFFGGAGTALGAKAGSSLFSKGA